MDAKNGAAMNETSDNDQMCIKYSPETSLLLQQTSNYRNDPSRYNVVTTNSLQLGKINQDINNLNIIQTTNISDQNMSMNQNYIYLDQNTIPLSESFYAIPNFFINSQPNIFPQLEMSTGNIPIEQGLAFIQEMNNNEIYGSCNNVPSNCQTFKDETIGLNAINSIQGLPFVYNMAQYPHENISSDMPSQRSALDVNPSIYVNKSTSKLSEAEDWTPNPNKLLDILGELEKLNEIINKLKDECDLPNAKPNLKREKNRLASKACRLKKKVTHETNKIKLEGLEIEFKVLIHALHFMSWEIIAYISLPQNRTDKLSIKIGEIYKKYLNGIRVAGDSDNFVKTILQHSRDIDPTLTLNIMQNEQPQKNIYSSSASQHF